jgi:hypothetical protein
MSQTYNFKTFPQLETSRFLLRQTTEKDWKDLLHLYSPPEIVEHLPLGVFITEEEALRELRCIKAFSKMKPV